MKRIVGMCGTGLRTLNNNANNHIFITGKSGTGKTHLIYILTVQAIYENIPVVVLDVGNSFNYYRLPDNMKEYLSDKMTVFDASKGIIPVNPFAFKVYTEDNEVHTETEDEVAGRIASMLKAALKLGEQQHAGVLRTLKELFKEIVSGIDFEFFYQWLSEQKGPCKSAASKLYPIINSVRFSANPVNVWNDILDNNSILTVFQLSKLDSCTQKVAIDFILDDLNKHISINGTQDKPFLLVLDEIQNINTTEGSPIGKLLTESRKYGASLICSTQFQDFNRKNTIITQQLEQAATRVYFKPGDDEILRIAKLLSNGNLQKWKNILKTMGVGCCIIEDGRTLNEADMLVKVMSMETLFKELNIPKLLCQKY